MSLELMSVDATWCSASQRAMLCTLRNMCTPLFTATIMPQVAGLTAVQQGDEVFMFERISGLAPNIEVVHFGDVSWTRHFLLAGPRGDVRIKHPYQSLLTLRCSSRAGCCRSCSTWLSR